MKLLLDEQISGKVAERLRDRGHDVTAATDDPSLRSLKDSEIFEAAQRQGRAVVTYNRSDFEPIIREYVAQNREHHGLVIVHPVRFPNWEFAWLTAAIEGLLDGVNPGRNFVIWLQEPT